MLPLSFICVLSWIFSFYFSLFLYLHTLPFDWLIDWLIERERERGGGGFDPINHFKPATVLYMSHRRTWISISIWTKLFAYVVWCERFVLLTLGGNVDSHCLNILFIQDIKNGMSLLLYRYIHDKPYKTWMLLTCVRHSTTSTIYLLYFFLSFFLFFYKFRKRHNFDFVSFKKRNLYL